MLNLYDMSRMVYERLFLQLVAGCKPSCALQHARDFADLLLEQSASVTSLRMSQPAMPQEERAWRRGSDANLAEDVLSKTSRKAPALVTAAVPAADSTVRR